jgi:hypothetical protein
MRQDFDDANDAWRLPLKRAVVTCLAILAMGGLGLFLMQSLPAGAAAPDAAWPVTFGKPFWKHWSDGRAELASYDLSIPRDGQSRKGLAVTIVIPETFSNKWRVKADPGKHPPSDEFPVLKLNLVQDFPTGIYDYNLMTSVFITMARVNGRPAGSPTKISFSAQEWCGHVWRQLLFDADGVREISHSYFDGEGDETGRGEYPRGGVSEDALLLWARGWAGPRVMPGAKVEVPLFDSLRLARFRHEPPGWRKATLSHSTKSMEVTVPAGTFETDVFKAAVEGGRRWTFYAEEGGARRLVKWETSDGEEAQLVAVERLKYWEMSANTFSAALEGLGLKPRPPRTP